MTTKRGQRAGASQVRSLRNILDLETANGFADRAVAGGLDRFLATLRGQAGADPALRSLDERGLLSVAYAEFDATRRERWAEEVRRFLGDRSTPPPARRDAPTAEPQPAPPARDPLDVPLSALRSVNRTQGDAIRRMLIRRRMLTHLANPPSATCSTSFPCATSTAGSGPPSAGSAWARSRRSRSSSGTRTRCASDAAAASAPPRPSWATTPATYASSGGATRGSPSNSGRRSARRRTPPAAFPASCSAAR